jgi:hypothetical protein
MTTADAGCPNEPGQPADLPDTVSPSDLPLQAVAGVGRRDRRRPLRDIAAAAAHDLTTAEKASLVIYWASVAPAAFLVAVEAFEQDSRW